MKARFLLGKMNPSSLCKIVHNAVCSIGPKILSRTSLSTIVNRGMHIACYKPSVTALPGVSGNNLNCANLLVPTVPWHNTVCGMKVKGQLELRCKSCYFVWRRGRKFVMCKTHPRHKQAQIQKKEYKTWILTHATQSPKRPW